MAKNRYAAQAMKNQSKQHIGAIRMPAERRAMRSSLMIAVLVIVAGSSMAQDDVAAPASDQPNRPLADETSLDLGDLIASQFDFSLTPGLWLPRLGGDITFGPSSTAREFSIEDHFDLDNLEPTLNIEFDVLKREQWNLHFDFFDYSTEESGTMPVGGVFGPLTLAAGDAYETSFDLTSFHFEASYRMWNPYHSDSAQLYFSPGAGLRLLMLEHDFTQTGIGSVEQRSDWLGVFGSMSLDAYINMDELFPVIDELQLTGRIASGPVLGGDGGLVTEINAEARAWVTPNFSVLFGYHFLGLIAEDDDYEFVGSIKGLFVGGTITW